MAYATDAEVKIYEQYIRSGMVEAAVSNIPLFGGALNSALVLRTEAHQGNYKYSSFIQKPTAPARRITSGASAYAALSINALAEEEMIGVKVSRGYNVGFTESSLKKLGTTPEAIALQIGRDYQAEKMKDMLHTSILCAETAIANQAAVNYDAQATSAKTASASNILKAFAKFGDGAGDIVGIVGHSTPWFDFTQSLVSDKVTGVYDGILQAFAVPSLNRRFGVVDAAALTDSGSPDTFNVLGLVRGAVECIESESESIAFERVVGLANLTRLFQAEYTFTIQVKGFKYNTAKGANPTDATLGLADTWTKVATSNKHLAGVRLKVQAA